MLLGASTPEVKSIPATSKNNYNNIIFTSEKYIVATFKFLPKKFSSYY